MAYYRKARPQNAGRKSGGYRSGPNRGRSGGRGNGERFATKIHPSKFINRAVAKKEEDIYEPLHKFSDFPFVEKLQENIVAIDYVSPSPIQDQAIPFVTAGKDLIGLANTGTGKTAAFLLPIIDKVSRSKNRESVLVLAPTRELAQQIEEELRKFAKGMEIYSTLLVGGTNIERQISQLRRRPHFVIATPGRAMDLLKRGKLSLDRIETFIVDEADRMLDMGFINDIQTIADKLPEKRQTLFFSATMTPKIKILTERFLRSPEIVSVKTADTSRSVDQDIIEVRDKDEKMNKLIDMLGGVEYEKVLLFGKTKHGVQRLSETLCKQGFSSVAIHGNKTQSQRMKALRTFKNNEAKIMVATDVAARGLDIPNVSHVINFDQPATYEDYVHRIGRTGRGSCTGVAWTFVERR